MKTLRAVLIVAVLALILFGGLSVGRLGTLAAVYLDLVVLTVVWIEGSAVEVSPNVDI